jgi:hypothetical protein
MIECLCWLADLGDVVEMATSALRAIQRKLNAVQVVNAAVTHATTNAVAGDSGSGPGQLVGGWKMAAPGCAAGEAQLGQIIAEASAAVAQASAVFENIRATLHAAVSPADRLLTNCPLGLKVLFIRLCQAEGRADAGAAVLDFDVANLYRETVISCYHRFGSELSEDDRASKTELSEDDRASIAFAAGFDTPAELEAAAENLCGPCMALTSVADPNIYICGSCIRRVQTSWPEFRCPSRDARGARCPRYLFLNNQLQLKYPDRTMHCADCHKEAFRFASWKAERKTRMAEDQAAAVVGAKKKRNARAKAKGRRAKPMSAGEKKRIERRVRGRFYGKKKKKAQPAHV